MLTSYAQNFEDVILWRALKDVENGFYIDVGAQDPVNDSVSLAFYERGWRGVHVEPFAVFARKLREARPDEEVLELALGREEGEIKFYEIADTGLSTGDEGIAREHEAKGFEVRQTSTRCRRLSSVLDAYQDRDIHWLKIDVEGMEDAVIDGWRPSPVRPWIVLVESTRPNSPEPNYASWEAELLALGYEFVYFDGLNRFYVSNQKPELKAHFGAGPNYFDDFVLTRTSYFSQGLAAELTEWERLSAAEQAARAFAEQQAREVSERALAAEREAEAARERLAGEQAGKAAIEQRLAAEWAARTASEERLVAERSTRAELARDLAAEHAARRASEERLVAEQSAQAELARELAAEHAARTASEERFLTERAELEQHLAAERAARAAAEGRLAIEWNEKAAVAQDLNAERTARAALEHQIAALLASTSWRLTAPLRLTSRATGWFGHGIWAWLTLKPGTRPRRTARKAAARIIQYVRTHPTLAASARRALGSFPRLEQRLKLIAISSRDEQTTKASGEKGVSEPAELFFEPAPLVRLAYRRLLAAARSCSSDKAPQADGGQDRLRLAFVSPLPPTQSGIADYSAQILPALSRFYDIVVIVDSDDVELSKQCGSYSVRSNKWFELNCYDFDRVVYHVGNSHFHHYMFPLMRQVPGVVVLHDFHLSDTLCTMEDNLLWINELYSSYGYREIAELIDSAKKAQLEQFNYAHPSSGFVIRGAQGVLAHNSYSQALARREYGDQATGRWAVIPLPREIPAKLDRSQARRALGYSDDDFVVCSFGQMGPTKLNDRLVRAWENSTLAKARTNKLVFVGKENENTYGQELRRAIRASRARRSISITNFATPEFYRQYLTAADVAVQLRTRSRGETSAAALDCIAYGLPTIVNANGSMAEFPQDSVLMLPDEFTDGELVVALESLRNDEARRTRLKVSARAIAEQQCALEVAAERSFSAIEKFATTAVAIDNLQEIKARAKELAGLPADAGAWVESARRLAAGAPIRQAQRQLLVDVSVLAQEDLRTGIQRVVRSQLLALIRNPPPGYRIEPVRLTDENGRWHYRYARRYALRTMNLPAEALDDDPITVSADDIFFIADYFTGGIVVAARLGIYSAWRAAGARFKVMVYDQLPLLRPDFFPPTAKKTHEDWLLTVCEIADCLICISEAVADDTRNWLASHHPESLRNLRIVSNHLGADVDASAPTVGLPPDAAATLAAIRAKPAFLMVGTIEPRKGHAQTLAAFERLWARGVDVNLVIVGKQGWHMEGLMDRLRSRPQLGKSLFLLAGASDEYLEKVYAAATCLIAASEGEGFGLPLIEAARHKLPVLARDLPVFREVAGEHAAYFDGLEAEDLADAVSSWLMLYREGRHPKSDDMPRLTWVESTERLKRLLLEDGQV